MDRRKHKWLCARPAEISLLMHTELPLFVMVLGIMNNEGHVMTFLFFLQGFRVKTVAYTEIIKTL